MAAKQSYKPLVIITNNQARINLAASAQLPIAKNLQSKPELAEISAIEVDDGEDIIDGSQLPIGELAKTADTPVEADDMSLDGIDISDATGPKKAIAPGMQQTPRSPKVKSGVKVPNFGKFRKKLVLLIGGGVLLVIFLIWAIFFAARATVVITAKTTSMALSQTVTLSTAGPTSIATNTLKAVRQEQKKPQSVDFDATGQKDVGQKASGTMKLTRTSVSSSPITVPAGTSFTSGTFTFVSLETATLAGTSVGPGGIVQDTATVRVQAAASGEAYNLAATSYQSNVGGFSSQGSAMSGGTTKIITIVTAADVQKAAESLATQEDPAIKAQLVSAFGKGVKIIDTSYSVAKSDPVSVPAVGQEATAKAKLTTELTYSMMGVSDTELGGFLDASLAEKVDSKTNQRAYDNGRTKAVFTDFALNNNVPVAKLTANGQIGPKINDDAIKQQAKGQNYGDIQAKLEAIEGVDTVDIKFWPFWVSSVPNDTNRITVEFKLNEPK